MSARVNVSPTRYWRPLSVSLRLGKILAAVSLLLFHELRVAVLFREILSALLCFGVVDAEQAPGDQCATMRPQRVKRYFLP